MCDPAGSARSIYGRNGNMSDGRQASLRASLRQPPCGFVGNASRCQQPARPTTTEAVNRCATKSGHIDASATVRSGRPSQFSGLCTALGYPITIPSSEFVNPQRADQNSPLLGPPLKLTRTGKLFFIMLAVPRLLMLAFVQLSRNQSDQDQDSPFTVDAFQDPCGRCGDL